MDIQSLLGDDADDLLSHTCKGVPREDLVLPGADFLDRVFVQTDRSPVVLRNLGALYSHGRDTIVAVVVVVQIVAMGLLIPLLRHRPAT